MGIRGKAILCRVTCNRGEVGPSSVKSPDEGEHGHQAQAASRIGESEPTSGVNRAAESETSSGDRRGVALRARIREKERKRALDTESKTSLRA